MVWKILVAVSLIIKGIFYIKDDVEKEVLNKEKNKK